MEKLKEIKASLEKLDNQFKEARGNMDTKPADEMYYKIMDNLYYSLQGIREYIYSVQDSLIDHKTKGHIPPILGAEKMQNAMETLGISEDYDLQKPVVYVRASRQGNKEFSVDLNIK